MKSSPVLVGRFWFYELAMTRQDFHGGRAWLFLAQGCFFLYADSNTEHLAKILPFSSKDKYKKDWSDRLKAVSGRTVSTSYMNASCLAILRLQTSKSQAL
jgi:thiosulfate reductase cytochrome b subunit